MSVESFFNTLTHIDKLQVLDLTLPGIDEYLKDVLAKEELSDAGEKLRLQYVKLLENSKPNSDVTLRNEGFIDLKDTGASPLVTPPFQVSRFEFEDADGSSEVQKSLQNNDEEPSTDKAEEKAAKRPRPRRKDTDSTEESGVFISTQSLSQSTEGLSVSGSQVETSSRDTFVSDSECEFLEWESDVNVVEDGYCTGDNIESYLEHLDIQPNENGELYMGVMYVREQPGWHKRWLIITERCLKCYKHRTEDKMLFEIPLQNARIIPTDRKRSRMFPITLSIPKLKDAITFATTEEQTRQEWIYVINHVIRKLVTEEAPQQGSPEFPRKISFNTLMQSGSVEEMRDRSHSRERAHGTSEPENTASNVKENRCLSEVHLGVLSEKDKRRTWHAGSEGNFSQLKIEVSGEESPDMDTSLSPTLAEEESFRELRECLPDILQRPSALSTNRRKSAATGGKDRKTLSFSSSDVDIRARSTSDLSAQPRIKRHGSLANSLSSKAAKVKSKISSSFFKKGKRDDRVQRDLGLPSATFSGYLSRKKGHSWKSRWCVVKEHTMYCYKDFGVGLAELELTLGGCGVTAVFEGEGEKPFMFILTAEKEELYFAAENDAELEEWIMVLETEAKRVPSILEQAIDTPSEVDESHLLTTLSSPDTPEENRKNEEDDTSTKRGHTSPKTRKDSKTHTSSKKTSMLGALAHKFHVKSKTKHPSDAKTSSSDDHVDTVDGFVVVPYGEKDEDGDDVTILSEGPTLDGSLCQRVNQDWLPCSVRLIHHTLYFKCDSDNVRSLVLKCRLLNCVVLDCSDTEGPLVMVVKKSTGESLYLKAESESDFIDWKETISAALLTSPSTTRRLMSKESSTDSDTYRGMSVPARVKIAGDSFDSVFGRDDTDVSSNATSVPSTPVSPLIVQSYPSPRASTAGDVSSAESEEDGRLKCSIPIQRSFSAGGIDSMRTQSAIHSSRGRRRRGSPLRRTISNALASLDLSPNKRRSKTFGGLGIAASLLYGIKHTSCLSLRNSKGIWTKRWCVLQQDKLHFFTSGDDLAPTLTLPLVGCKVKKIQRKGKQFSFELKIPSENVECCLAAESDDDLTQWIEMLKAEASQESSDASKHRGLDLLNGILPRRKDNGIVEESKPDVALGSEFADTTNNNIVNREKATSLLELRRIRETVQTDDDDISKNLHFGSSSSLHQKRATSLEEVLNLLQEQQLLQNLGQTRYVRAKKARVNWKKSAAAILKDQTSRPDSPNADMKENGVEDETLSEAGSERQTKARAISIVSSSSDLDDALTSCQNSKDALDMFDKLAEEEKLKALKTETLLRKRRNSLNLEKEVLEKKIEKNSDKKVTVKKLLGKEHVSDKEGIIRAQKRLKEVNGKLADINHDIEENKTKEAEIMGNINELKTKSAKEFSIKRDSISYKGTCDERRTFYKHSPQGSTSSRESFDGGVETHRSSTSSLDTPLKRKGSKKQASLVALEEELKKISPMGGRKAQGRKRISVSSEGSIDEYSLRESPPRGRRSISIPGPEKRDSSSSEGSLYGFERLNSFSSEAAEGRRKKFSSPSFKRTELYNVAVEIPTRKSSSGSVGEPSSLPKGSGEHRASLITALSQIKDFEDFLASTRQ